MTYVSVESHWMLWWVRRSDCCEASEIYTSITSGEAVVQGALGAFRGIWDGPIRLVARRGMDGGGRQRLHQTN